MFKKRISPFACIVIALCACAVTFVSVFSWASCRNAESNIGTRIDSGASAGEGSRNAAYDRFSEIIDMINSKYLRDYKSDELWTAAYKAAVRSLGDAYSDYYTAEEYSAMLDSSKGDFVGIGVHACYDEDTGGVYIFRVMPDSPAQEAGILDGDVIVEAAGTRANADNYYDIIDLIRGKEGTKAEIKVLRGGEELEFSVTRRSVPSENVLFSDLGSGVAYVRILSFSDMTVASLFEKTVNDALNSGFDKFIFDVRNNGGGYLDQVLEMLDILLPEGPIINIVDKNGNTETKYSDAECIKAEMVVLCNGSTASAAELFTAALRDYGLATIIGEQTFGKGTMQTTYRLTDEGDAIKLSTDYYNPPSNVSYDGVGITPDIVSKLGEEWEKRFFKMHPEDDTQLKRALEVITGAD